MSSLSVIAVETFINQPVEKVWALWTEPQNIQCWNHASNDWHTPYAENNLQVGGHFLYRMEAKDGSFGFDFSGTYTQVILHDTITYTADDDRKVSVFFKKTLEGTQITENFEAEETNPIEMQKMGWQSILDNFKKYAESQ